LIPTESSRAGFPSPFVGGEEREDGWSFLLIIIKFYIRKRRVSSQCLTKKLGVSSSESGEITLEFKVKALTSNTELSYSELRLEELEKEIE